MPMPSLLYHALWIAIALVGIAAASALIARRLRQREFRRVGAEAMLDALAGYSEWLAGQRRTAAFPGDLPPEVSALTQVRRLQQARFPELSFALVRLLEVHTCMIDFLWKQQLQRTRDPEGWLDSDHDRRFIALWREHRQAVHLMADRLRALAGEGLVDAEPESVFPA